MFEIYNESVYDLLAPKKLKRDLRLSSDGITVEVVGSEMHRVENKDQMIAYLTLAADTRRASRSTEMNVRSSRSHCICILHIRGHHPVYKSRYGQLNFIDLAGSERLNVGSSSGAIDAALLKETQSINSSLSCLSNVISAINQKRSHVPYRDSKLTYLLQNSLNGGSATKVCMIANISPEAGM